LTCRIEASSIAGAMRALILLAIAISGTLISQAQTARANRRPLSLEECIDLALTRNLDLQIQHLSAEIARQQLSGTYGAYDSTFSFEIRREVENSPYDFAPQKLNPDFPYELTRDYGRPSLSGRLPYGLSYDMSARAGWKQAITDFSSSVDDSQPFPWGIRETNNYFADTRIEGRQHLLKDFWIDQDRLSILIGRKNIRVSQETLRFQTMRTVFAIELAYYDLVAAQEAIRVHEQALKLREQLVAETRKRVQVGDLPPLDIDQAETQLENTITAISLAREAFVSRENTLKALFTDNFSDWADIELDPSELPAVVPVVTDRSASFQRALKNRPDLVEARIIVEKNDATVQFRFNQLFPNLDLVGGYGNREVESSFGNAVESAFRFQSPDYYYGVVVSMPLTNIRERSAYRVSKTQREIAALELKKAEQAVLVQVADWINRAHSRYDQVTSTRRARGHAEAALAAEEKKLQNGFSTSFVVLQLQETLTEARTAEVQAQSEYHKALAQLAFAEATTLDRHHLLLEVK
jgi:outer membrane protein TolC